MCVCVWLQLYLWELNWCHFYGYLNTCWLIKTIFVPVMMMMNHYPMKVFSIGIVQSSIYDCLDALPKMVCKNWLRNKITFHIIVIFHTIAIDDGVIKIKRAPFQWLWIWWIRETNRDEFIEIIKTLWWFSWFYDDYWTQYWNNIMEIINVQYYIWIQWSMKK